MGTIERLKTWWESRASTEKYAILGGSVLLASAVTVFGVNALDADKTTQADTTTTMSPEQYRALEAQDNQYTLRSLPFNQQKTDADELSLEKNRNTVTPICYEVSATLAVDSYLAEVYIKGQEQPAVGYISNVEFPDFDGSQYPDCTDDMIAQINVAELSAQG